MKSLFATRTFWYNALSALSLILLLPELQSALGPNVIKWIVLVNAIINIILRYVTTTPVKSLTGSDAPKAYRAVLLPLLLIAGMGLSSCGAVNVPPNLTPQATVAFNNMQIQRALDTIRDIVDDGTKTTPPVFSKAEDVKVATWHEAAIKTMHAGPGWKAQVLTGLDQVLTGLTPAQQATLKRYVELAKSLVRDLA